MAGTLNTHATQTTAVTVAPHLRRKLLTELQVYAELAAQKKAIEQAMETHKAAIEAVRAESGATNLECAGFKVSYVAPVQSRLDKEALLKAGVTMAQLEAGTVTRPSTPYTKIALPGQKG